MYITNEGNTRLVILFPTFVVKIAKIKILWIFVRIWVHITRKTEKRALATLRGIDKNLFKALLFFLFAGVIANREEYLFWKRYKHPHVAETYFSFFGLFNIQVRGAAIDEGCKNWSDYLTRAQTLDAIDIQGDFLSAKNLSVVSGKMVIHDYGHKDTRKAIVVFGRILFP